MFLKKYSFCISLLLFTVSKLAACSCPYFVPGPELIKQDAKSAEIIFIGKVIDSAFQQRTFSIIRNFKGLENRKTIISRNFDFCSTLYDDGYYILYGNQIDTFLNTSYCSCNEKIVLENYDAVGAYDTTTFENLLRSGIENHNLHINYLLTTLSSKRPTSNLFSLWKNTNWYRNYTVSDSLWMVAFFLLLLATLFVVSHFYKIHLGWLKIMSYSFLLSVLSTLVSLFIYGESRPRGIDTGIIDEYYGFPKYVFSRNIKFLTGTEVEYDLYYINFLSNIGLFLTLYLVIFTAYYIIIDRQPKK